MPADVIDVVSVMRAVSEDPSAYAALRSTQIQECAVRLADVPAKATEDDFRSPARDCASGLGVLDGIADDIPQQERRQWRTDVFAYLADTSPKPPSYREDPVGHIVGSWRQGFAGAKPGETGFLEGDILDLTDTWAVGRGEDPAREELEILRMDTRNDASSSTVRTGEAMKCTRKPEEQSCP